MASLFAGPRRGFTAYTADKLRIGDTYYIAYKWGPTTLISSGIVKILDMNETSIKVQDKDDDSYYWVVSKKDFLRTANNFTDLMGNPNPMITQRVSKWWQFWKK